MCTHGGEEKEQQKKVLKSKWYRSIKITQKQIINTNKNKRVKLILIRMYDVILVFWVNGIHSMSTQFICFFESLLEGIKVVCSITWCIC